MITRVKLDSRSILKSLKIHPVGVFLQIHIFARGIRNGIKNAGVIKAVVNNVSEQHHSLAVSQIDLGCLICWESK